MAAFEESMLSVLKQLGLQSLAQNFEKEKVEVNIVPTLKDEEIRQLGVEALGDRIRLRQICAKIIRTASSGTTSSGVARGPSQTTPRPSEAIRERLNLFSSRRTQPRNRSTGKRSNSSRSWTPQFFCLANREAAKVPTANEKQELIRAGLGLKKIKLELEDDEETVLQKIVSGDPDEDGQPKGFPRLKGIGGFEMLFCGSNSRELKLLKCARTAKQLRY